MTKLASAVYALRARRRKAMADLQRAWASVDRVQGQLDRANDWVRHCQREVAHVDSELYPLEHPDDA